MTLEELIEAEHGISCVHCGDNPNAGRPSVSDCPTVKALTRAYLAGQSSHRDVLEKIAKLVEQAPSDRVGGGEFYSLDWLREIERTLQAAGVDVHVDWTRRRSPRGGGPVR